MLRLLRDAHMYHQDPTVPVLIEGETGVGKEVFAKLIHYGDGTTDSPFVAINCSAIPHHLFEGELFGHEAGAYTGSAPKGQAGKLELAANGSLFLDEVADTDIQVQPKLLRVLEDRTFYRLGGLRKRDFNARIICAANMSLAGMVESGAIPERPVSPVNGRPSDYPSPARACGRYTTAHRHVFAQGIQTQKKEF